MRGATVPQMQAVCGFVFPNGSARSATVASYRLGSMFRPHCPVMGLVDGQFDDDALSPEVKGNRAPNDLPEVPRVFLEDQD
jgi:hypothetical protein